MYTGNNIISCVGSFCASAAAAVCQSFILRGIAAEGIAKLLLSGRILSQKLLARLLVLWFNPTTQDEDRLRAVLGLFFPAFAASDKYRNLSSQPCCSVTSCPPPLPSSSLPQELPCRAGRSVHSSAGDGLGSSAHLSAERRRPHSDSRLPRTPQQPTTAQREDIAHLRVRNVW